MRRKRIKIVVFTDCHDIAYNEIYQSLDKNLYDYGLDHYQIDPVVTISNFSIVNAAFKIRLLAEVYQSKSLFLVIMNGQPNNPERIFGTTKKGLIFVGNNCGYFNWLFNDFGIASLYKNRIDRSIDNRSFGGKYVQVPTACKILAGVPFEKIGIATSTSLITDYEVTLGSVVHCDNFGLMKIFDPRGLSFSEGQKLKIFVNDNPVCDAFFSKNLKCHPDGSWVLFKGSSLYGLPELGMVQSENSAKILNVKLGDKISWKTYV